jgi:hypothetical protein
MLPLLWGVEPSTTRCRSDRPDCAGPVRMPGHSWHFRLLVTAILAPPRGLRLRPASGPGSLRRDHAMPRVPRRTWPVKRVGLKPVNADRVALARLKHVGLTASLLKPWAPAPEGRASVVRYRQVAWRERDGQEPRDAKDPRVRPRHHGRGEEHGGYMKGGHMRKEGAIRQRPRGSGEHGHGSHDQGQDRTDR